MTTKREGIISACYECIRDAHSTENIRAIQDSEGPISIEQKKMIKMLVAQGWSKNEIIYEMQRVFGNDVLILTKSLDDERSLAAKVLPLAAAGLLFGLMFLRRGKMNRIQAKDSIKKTKKSTKFSRSKSATVA